MLVPIASTVADVATSVLAVATAGLLIAACVAGGVAKRQLGGLREQVTDQRLAQRRGRVFEHLAQLFDGDFVEMDTEAQQLFTERLEDPAGWEALWKARGNRKKRRITAAMNFYEVIAGEYNDPSDELLDRTTANKALAYIADRMWIRAEPFVHWLREYFEDERAYVEWEQLHLTFTRTEGLAKHASSYASPSKPTDGSAHGTTTSTPAPAPAGAQTAGQSPPQEPTMPATVQAESPSNSACANESCVPMPRSVLVVAILWTVALVGAFFAYIEIEAVADFFPSKVGGLPFSAIWFGAVGGLLISLQGIFEHNRCWLSSYDYWHYLRPVLGAIMGTVGCLVFIVLTSAAASGSAPSADATFYAVVALALGYREQSFRELLTKLIDTVILPSEGKEARAGTGSSSSASSTFS